MLRRLVIILLVLAGAIGVAGRELGRRVHLKEGQNVVAGTGEKLDFRLTAERDAGGSVLVKLSIPAGSELQQASYTRLEIVREGKILLWSKLASQKEDDGSMTAGFQVDESLAKDAFVVITFDRKSRPPRNMFAYHIALADYVRDRAAR